MTNETENRLTQAQRVEATPPFSFRRSRSRPRFDKVRVAETGRYGLGVFAEEPIRMGRAVGRVHGELKPTDYRSHYCMDFEGGVLEPDAPYRFLNHCCEPNCQLIEWEIEGEDASDSEAPRSRKFFELWVHALRDIEKGEELTIDYGWDWKSAIPCKCGSPHCRGWICRLDELDLCRELNGDPANYLENQDEET
ncbi:MAG: SET domain-containing protein [Thermoguttaceae bacterium]|jgi:hypothetical protein